LGWREGEAGERGLQVSWEGGELAKYRGGYRSTLHTYQLGGERYDQVAALQLQQGRELTDSGTKEYILL
jgi:hypothetical protein